MRKIRELLKKRTSIDIIINTLGNYVNLFFTAIFTLAFVRVLSPTDFGVYSVLTSITYVMSNVLDFGTTATIYSYLPPLLEDKTKSVYRFVKSTFFYQTIFSSVVIILLLMFFPLLDKHFFKTDAPYYDLAIAAIAIMFFIWQNFLLNIYFAAKKFLKANTYNNVSHLIKLGLLFIAYLTDSINITSMLIIFTVIGPFIFFAFVLWDKKDHLHNLLQSDVHQSEFRFKYTITYFIASQFLNIGLRMDLFLLSYYRAVISQPEVGFYSLAQKIILTIMTTVVSITQVLSPSFTQITKRGEALKEMKHGLVYMLLPSALFVGVFITPTWVYELFFTVEFVESAAIARNLALPFILYAMGSIPMLFLLYTVKKPKPILIAYSAFFVIVTVGNYLLIPQLRMFAPPILLLVGFVVATSIIGLRCWKEYKALPAR